MNHTFNTTPIKKLQNYPLIITIKRMFCLLKTAPGIAFMFTSWSQHHFVTIEHLKQASNKVSHSASNNGNQTLCSHYCYCIIACLHLIDQYFIAHPIYSWCIMHSTPDQPSIAWFQQYQAS